LVEIVGPQVSLCPPGQNPGISNNSSVASKVFRLYIVTRCGHTVEIQEFPTVPDGVLGIYRRARVDRTVHWWRIPTTCRACGPPSHPASHLACPTGGPVAVWFASPLSSVSSAPTHPCALVVLPPLWSSTVTTTCHVLGAAMSTSSPTPPAGGAP